MTLKSIHSMFSMYTKGCTGYPATGYYLTGYCIKPAIRLIQTLDIQYPDTVGGKLDIR